METNATTTAPLILADLYEMTRQAHTWLSHNPENAAKILITDYSNQLTADLESMPEEFRETYTKGYREKFTAYIHAKSRCASSFITGGSNFPVRQQEKRHATERRRADEFSEWRSHALDRIKKIILGRRTPEEVNDSAWQYLYRDIRSSVKTIKEIDAGINTYSARALFVSSIVGKIERLAYNGNTDLVQRALQYLRDLNTEQAELGRKPIITERNKLWLLEKKAEEKQAEITTTAGRESEHLEGVDGKTAVINFAEDRVQLFFKDKAQAMAHKGKGYLSGWNWSHRNTAWQRKITPDAVRRGKEIICVILVP